MGGQTFILRENVLTDNVLILAPNGYTFKNGIIGVIKEYSYQNHWSDSENRINFKSRERLISYLKKNYPSVEIDFTDTRLE